MDSPVIYLYNTLTRTTEPLKPIKRGNVGIYCCGPTVYNYQHIGNLRCYIFEDILVRTLRYAGYNVKHVMNITDVGHLVSDADEGEDKMLLAARREGKTSKEIADYYTQVFFEHCSWLNITRPTIICKATEHIPDMINLVKKLEEKGLAYKSGGNVYFDVTKFPEYGKLANLDLNSLKAGARIEVDKNKRNPFDFALWFTKSKFENQELLWDSPWGKGYPGWHLECSSMSMKYLGEHFDIHCGGVDHIPVHHTNEIAQSEGATGKRFVNIWMHGAFLVTEKEKMSKSTGQFLTLDVIKEKGFDPLSYRLFCLGTSYRHELKWSWKALEAAQNSLNKIKSTVLSLSQGELKNQVSFNNYLNQFNSCLFNDLATPKGLKVFYDVLNAPDLTEGEKLKLAIKFDDILGLGIENLIKNKKEIPSEVITLAEKRKEARKQKNWALADSLRTKISELGYDIEDTPDGYKLKERL